MAEPITHVGLDVLKETIAVVLAMAGKQGEAREQAGEALSKSGG